MIDMLSIISSVSYVLMFKYAMLCMRLMFFKFVFLRFVNLTR